MPISVAGLSSSIIFGLTSVGFTGVAKPQLAMGLAIGTMAWVRSLTVITADAGTAGTGTGFLPWAVPVPLITTNLMISYPLNSHNGAMAMLEAQGLGLGLGLGFVQGAMVTVHAGVGTGTGIAKVVGSPAFPFLIAGLLGVGMTGPGSTQKANAISQALSRVLLVFTLPIPIVGSVTPAGASGVGTGKIL